MYDAASGNESAGPLSCLPQQFTVVYFRRRIQEGVLLSRCDSLGAGLGGQTHPGNGGSSSVSVRATSGFGRGRELPNSKI